MGCPLNPLYGSCLLSTCQTILANSFPGYSVHDELEHLVKAGFSPGEALEAATRRAAEMLDAEDEFGTIEPGKRADLLILSANPLENIRNTRSLQIVISEGQVINREALLGNNK